MVETLKELALRLNGREYGHELDGISESMLKDQGLVVLFGYSDDNMEFRGAIDEEIGCYGGGEALLTKNGLLINECDNEDCPYFEQLKPKATKIEAVWDTEGYSWIFKTTIPHETFEIMEDGEKFCRGIVFNLSEVGD